MALLGCGFDPGVTNVFCAYAQQELFDEIHTVDIIDCNAGDHGTKQETGDECVTEKEEPPAQGAWGGKRTLAGYSVPRM